jgi:hypothetical protein
MVNWQFYGEDDKSNTPPPIKKNKFNWTGIPVFILICVGINKFIGGEMKNNSTNSFIREPVLHTSPVNFVPTNNDFNNELFPLPVSPIIPEWNYRNSNKDINRNLKDINIDPIKLVNPQSLKDFSKFRNSNKDINWILKDINIDPIKSDIVNYDIPPTYISNETNLNINTSLPNINIIPENSILNQKKIFDSRIKIEGSLD